MREGSAAHAEAVSARIAELRSQQDALLAAIEGTRLARSLTFSDDEHDPDGSTASLDQVRDVALLEHVEQRLRQLARAEQRLAAGTYGVCEVCGQEISTERLLARPETQRCVACAARGSRRPGRARGTGDKS